MRRALTLARRALGSTSPNPMVGAVITRGGRVLGEGYHHAAGRPHAEIEALRDAARRGRPSVAGATLYVTLEPCCTQGLTPPCVDAVLRAGIAKVFVAAVDPNPSHSGRGLDQLSRAGVKVAVGLLAPESMRLNEAFNHWIVERTPFVTVKAAMTLDGKIATATGESQWITGEKARASSMRLRGEVDAILVGVNTVILDNPRLSFRSGSSRSGAARRRGAPLRRVVLDSSARTPADARVLEPAAGHETIIVTTRSAPAARVKRLAARATVWRSPGRSGRVSLSWLMNKLGREGVTHLLVEGGGEVNASFLLEGRAHRVALFYAPKILGGATAKRGVGGKGARDLGDAIRLGDPEWRRVGKDLFVTARINADSPECENGRDVRSEGQDAAG
ncbi:MAG: bifunctional diaminohydroxyphosphoribosylaminopyrimidine deaminase/5-amino-6-(5-phosphoribosylamino)uracil reductase RibD [Verrucomicrobia bacterium]|nr:bifunctional diaminohydroxyphosphoribosylaminopyrimidine deaminase/5-amino-6-(5-phosphoribosylamino)uracil reductase RibD [Verrucomicrobiota bacterium]